MVTSYLLKPTAMSNGLKGNGLVQHYGADGRLINIEAFHNAFTAEGRNHMLAATFTGETPFNDWKISLIQDAPGLTVDEGYTEADNPYTFITDAAWVAAPTPLATGLSNADTPAVHVAASDQVVWGYALRSPDNVLVAIVKFATVKNMVTGQSLSITYNIVATNLPA